MALRKLIETDCGGTNSLVQLTSHLTDDLAMKHIYGQNIPGSSDQLSEEFLQETTGMPQTFKMDDVMNEMYEIEYQMAQPPSVPALIINEQANNDKYALPYIQNGRHFEENVDFQDIWTDSLPVRDFNSDEWRLVNPVTLNEQVNNDKPEMEIGRKFDENFDFKMKLNDSLLKSDEWSPMCVTTSAQFNDSSNWKNVFMNSSIIDSNKYEFVWPQNYYHEEKGPQQDIEKNTTHIFDIIDENSNSEYDNWDEAAAWINSTEVYENEHFTPFEIFLNEYQGINEVDDTLTKSQFRDKYKLCKTNTDFEHLLTLECDNPSPIYSFNNWNPMFDVINPTLRGKELRNGGDLNGAMLCFELAIEKQPSNTEAWLLLGITQAENEQDSRAIISLKKCLEIEPSNLKALMNLAISYVNQKYFDDALMTLLAWLRENPNYKDLVQKEYSISDLEEKLAYLYIRAARRKPYNIDYEVQRGLGLALSLRDEFKKAADCFRAALTVRPNDSSLWNQLGLALMNGGIAIEGFEAYYNALFLDPGSIRVRYNIGVACMELNSYKEAVQHFLAAFNQQTANCRTTDKRIETSDTIWRSLRKCISRMNRMDLRSAVNNKDLKALNDAFEMDTLN